MKLSVVLFLGLIASALCAAKQDEVKSQASEPGSSRRGRFFFLSNLLGGPAALASAGANSVGKSFISLSNTLGGFGQATTTRPNIIYVQRQRQCLMPLFTRGCQPGYVCASVGTSGTRCVPQSPNGFACTTGFQCISGLCREHSCVKDECTRAGEISSCSSGQVCVSTRQGNRCQVRLNVNECPRPMTTLGCEKNQYCMTGARGNICTDKLPVSSICTDPVECRSGTCRNSKCKSDACPVIDMSIDCMPTQFCAPGETGNMCMAKKENGARCSAQRQCMSNVCENGNCVQDQCPHPYMPGRCLPTQFCSPAPEGNMCLERRNAGSMCRSDIECRSSICRNQRCVFNQCQTPFSTTGCDMTIQYCMSTTSGNQCVSKLGDGQSCLVATQCMSNNCASGRCAAGPPVLKQNGAACASPSECSSTFCVLGRCAANQMSLGGMCLAASDCQSMTCTNMRCVTLSNGSLPTTPTTPTTGTLLANGMACTADADCNSMRCLSRVCTAALLPIGGTCATNSDCVSNNCLSMACALGTVAGDSPCSDSTQCASALCQPNMLCLASPVTTALPTTTTMTPLLADGATCTVGTMCMSTFCVMGSCAAMRLASGATCVSSTDCTSLTCNAGTMGALTCA